MKVYVASKLSQKKQVQEIYKKLKGIGHEITVDWTVGKELFPYYDNPEESREVSQKDIDGVIDADCFILVSDEDGRGMFVEYGAAIYSNITRGKPKIFVIGERNDDCLFYFHPKAERVSTIEEVLQRL